MSAMRRLPDEPRLRVWRALLLVHAGVANALEDSLQEGRGIPLAWYQVLVELRLAGGALRMHQLADVATLSRSGTTRLVDRIEAEGLVARRVCPSDRRGLEVVLTAKGQEVQKGAGPLVLRGIQEHLGRHLTDQQAVALAALLETVMEAEQPGSAAPHP
jgi:DNA-binding MarR family transcriptional regulator